MCVFSLRDQIQLDEKTSMKIAKILAKPDGKPIDPIYMGIGADGKTIVNIEEKEALKL